jgi:hypothetical protein
MCTIKSLILCNLSLHALFSHVYFIRALHQHAIDLCCCILLCLLSFTKEVKDLLITLQDVAVCLLQFSLVRLITLYIPFMLLMFL